ncbi:hypothetical protein B0I35DRAFT_414394 [Stachybotrys elegans]|uniref:Uncharacterized protein n=1 Tax=Stachybotrys elegans TaxID=80388 RepID=A0A8K0SFJ2_9HYPO|nr:hypothetical protein B0I35DRAFT_414394 [Stachybotrys elegans]
MHSYIDFGQTGLPWICPQSLLMDANAPAREDPLKWLSVPIQVLLSHFKIERLYREAVQVRIDAEPHPQDHFDCMLPADALAPVGRERVHIEILAGYLLVGGFEVFGVPTTAKCGPTRNIAPRLFHNGRSFARRDGFPKDTGSSTLYSRMTPPLPSTHLVMGPDRVLPWLKAGGS